MLRKACLVSIMLIKLFGQSNDGCKISHRCLSLVAFASYKLSINTHQVILSIVVSLKLMLLLNVLFLLLIAGCAEGQQ